VVIIPQIGAVVTFWNPDTARFEYVPRVKTGIAQGHKPMKGVVKPYCQKQGKSWTDVESVCLTYGISFVDLEAVCLTYGTKFTGVA
jgi:hypothetical protein